MPGAVEVVSEYVLTYKDEDGDDDDAVATKTTRIVIASPGMGGAGSTGGRVWSCAPLMLDQLGARPQLVRHASIVELGAGLGLVGIAAACLGGHVVITDADEVCVEAARSNIERNAGAIRAGGGSAVACVLRWDDVVAEGGKWWRDEALGSLHDDKEDHLSWTTTTSSRHPPTFDVVLFSDCVYTDQGIESLSGAAAALLRRGRGGGGGDGGGRLLGVAGLRQRHLLRALVNELERRGVRLITTDDGDDVADTCLQIPVKDGSHSSTSPRHHQPTNGGTLRQFSCSSTSSRSSAGAAARSLRPTVTSAEVAATHQADADITERKSAGGYVWIEGRNSRIP